MKKYKLVIFDMDGTMYYQPPLRCHMALSLMGHYWCHPGKWKEIVILKCYRQIRERFKTADKGNLEQEIIEKTAIETKSAPETVEQIIRKWIFEEPINKLSHCRDHQAAELMRRLKGMEVQTVIYSDYPVADKIKALNLTPDFYFSGSDEGINSLKPDPAGMNYIMKVLKVKPEEVLVIGDRQEKDGEAAGNAGVDCMILSKYKMIRKKQYIILNKNFCFQGGEAD